MNYKIFLSYFLILAFFLSLIMAYMKYSEATNEAENSNLRQEIIEVLEKDINNLQSQIDELICVNHADSPSPRIAFYNGGVCLGIACDQFLTTETNNKVYE